MDTADIATKTIDLRGLKCPMPMVNTALEIRKMNVGETLKSIADDPATMKDIPSWAKAVGHDLLLAQEENGIYTYIIRKEF